MDAVIVYIETDLNPTEDEAKVKKAITNLIDNPVFTSEPAFQGCKLKAKAQGQVALTRFRNLLRSDRIRDAARKILYRASRDGGNVISFYLNKQVAYAGHVSFSEEQAESPLGPLHVVIETETPKQLIDWLAEKTEKEKVR
ncbi:MAG: hypothetical protein LBH62_06095 [Nitrososphaerota archaeon]|jgi:predicted RNA binding protein with dsRBD fold (UPF0201 family)|uniref:RNA-binding domain-containing protein n=1 Tax=Candidatus Bathycorpusculum sp. TaxID=2994959 RepID=UPI002836074A|nr:hypothetical protein [Candidatus Termiticorpusculum sp.]MCL2257421.1 hypothetical protein [Candidatus Termiticorpusculum sp.]MCL2292417.1 hypothetical protein [Candidatus Termiticorpusculum sp.]MDR0460986.1 hypothetical protein [Nitrososphaerota archaeon]